MKLLLGSATALIVALFVASIALVNLDWNRAKPWFDARVSEALGRPFAIAGELSLTWEKQADSLSERNESWRDMIPWPHLVATDIHIGNPALAPNRQQATPPWSTETASIRQFSFSLNPLALLERKIIIPVLRFDSPQINLWRKEDGENNWTFGSTDKPSSWQLQLERVIFTKGSIRVTDERKQANVSIEIDTLNADPVYGVAWQLRGKYHDEEISGAGKAGAVLSLQHQTTPYPILANLRAGRTVIAAEGTLTKPTDLAALDMHLKLSGASMAQLYSVVGVVLPETPPFITEGHLIATLDPRHSHLIYQNFVGKVGSSDIGGNLDYQSRLPRPLLSGTIVSRSLQFSDLAPLIGAGSHAKKTERGAVDMQPPNKVLPVEPFKTDRWTSIDADIIFSAGKIIREKKLPITALKTTLRLQDGVLSLLPLEFTIAGGILSSDIVLDGSGRSGKNAIKAEMKVSARHLKLQQLFPAFQPLNASVGEINGNASLSAIGNSVASLLGASNGEVKTLIDRGSISKLLLEEMGLNIGNVILTRLFGDKQVRINCMATDFGVTNGVMHARSFVIDTEDAVLDVSGNVSLTQEQLDLTIKPNSKGLRVFSLRTPLYVGGSFNQPEVSVDKGVLAMRTGGAVALAALAPLAALIPLINTGQRDDNECAKLLANARISPVAPAPGVAYQRKIKAVAK